MVGLVLSNSITNSSVDAWYFLRKLRRRSATNESSSQAMKDSSRRGDPSFELLDGTFQELFVTVTMLLTVWPCLGHLVQPLNQILLTHGLDQLCRQQMQFYASFLHLRDLVVQLLHGLKYFYKDCTFNGSQQ